METPLVRCGRIPVRLLAIFLALFGAAFSGNAQLPDHTIFNPSNPANPYGLTDLDNFPVGDYGYCKWGVWEDYNSTALHCSRLTTFASELFLNQDWATLDPLDVAAGQYNLGTETVTAPTSNYTLFRKMHFSNAGLKDATGGKIISLSPQTKKLIILVHGWNPGSESDMYASGNFWRLANALQTAIANYPDWQLCLYHWEPDSDTGPLKLNNGAYSPDAAINGSEAAEGGHQHGQHLGQLLEAATGQQLEKVHFICHSAGSWVGRSAIRYLLNSRATSPWAPPIKVELTLLDPFIPGTTAVHNLSLKTSNLTNAAMGTIENFSGATSETIFRLENYYANDAAPGTQEIFRGWSYLNYQLQVGGYGEISDPYGGHSGPIQFYADTVLSAMPGSSPIQNIVNGDFDLSIAGWQQSIFFREPIFAQQPTASPSTANSGDVITLSAQAVLRGSGSPSSTMGYRWETSSDRSNWTAVTTSGDFWGDSSQIVVTANSSQPYYRVSAKNSAGIEYSNPVTISFITSTGGAGSSATVPAAPTSLGAIAVSSSQINLSWTNNATNALGFKVERATSSAGPWTQIGTPSSSSFQSTGLSNSSTYYYRVAAYNSAGNSSYSNVASSTTQSVASATQVLTVNSVNPSSGAYVFLDTDKNGKGDGSTPLSNYVYNHGATLTLVATGTVGGNPFLKWQKDGVDYSSSGVVAYVTMDSDHTMTAVYGIPGATRTLTSVSISGPSSITENTSQQYTAIAYFSDGSSMAAPTATWGESGNGATISSSGVLSAGAVAADTQVNIAAAYSYGGQTVVSPSTPINILHKVSSSVYTLTLQSDGYGSVSASPSQSQYTQGSLVTIQAVPVAGYRFSYWTDNGAMVGLGSSATITMNSSRVLKAYFTQNVEQTGVQVFISPPEAVAAGAGWKSIGTRSWLTDWQPSGGSSLSMDPGPYRITFKDVPGWITPSDQQIEITTANTSKVSGTYTPAPGSLQVALSPPAAVSAGGAWRINGGDWKQSGETISGLTPGDYYLEFSGSTQGWMPPLSRKIQITSCQTRVENGIYSPPAGQPIINSISPNTGPISGGTPVTIIGANFAGDVRVLFDGSNAASVSVLSSTELSAVPPSRVSYGTVAVTVRTASGDAVVSNGFTYSLPRGKNLDLVGQMGGAVNAVAVDGNYTYLGEGAGLIIMDSTAPLNPIPKGRIAVPGLVRNIKISGSFAFLADNDGGLQVVDISNKTAPKVVSFFDTLGETGGVALLGGRAYLADGAQGLVILDVSNPKIPKLISQLALSGYSNRVAVAANSSGLFAYVAKQESQLDVVDVSSPTAPQLRGTVQTGKGGAYGVDLSGSYAYVCSEGVEAIDISNPDAPKSIGSFDQGNDSGNLLVRNGIVYSAGALGILLCNVSNPTKPVCLGQGTWEPLNYYMQDIALNGKYAYLAAGSNGLRIFDVSNTSTYATIPFSGSYTGLGEVWDVSVSANNAFLACNMNGLQVVDVSNPATMARVGGLTFPNTQMWWAEKSGNQVCMAGTIVDVTNPASPSLLANYTQSFVNTSTPYNGYLYCAAADTSRSPYTPILDVVSLANPSSPTRKGVCQLNASGQGTSRKVFVSGTLAFVADYDRGLEIVNVSNPSSPQLVATLDTPGSAQDLALSKSGQYLYIADGTSGIQAVNIADLAHPSIAANYGDGQNALAIKIVEDLAYVTGYGGLRVLDISDPVNPVLVASYLLPGWAQNVEVANGLIYVADPHGGLNVLRLRDTKAPDVFITNPVFQSHYQTNQPTITLGGGASDNDRVVGISWSNSRGGGGAASGTSDWLASDIQLAAGDNILTVSAMDTAGNIGSDTITVSYSPPDVLPPAISITYPTTASSLEVSGSTVELRGSASDNTAVGRIEWANSCGGTGTASGSNSWTASAIPLQVGINNITVTAYDTSNNATSATVAVKFTPPDTIAPSITIQFPTLDAFWETNFGTLNISGAAWDDRGVSQISWSNDQGGSGTLSGGETWCMSAVGLKPGLNVITLTAWDAAGNSGSDTLTVNYTPLPAVDFKKLGGKYYGKSDSGGAINGVAAPAKFQVSPLGSFTGSVYFCGAAYSISGKFAVDGTFTGSIPRKKQSPLNINLQVGAAGENVITGSLSDGTITISILGDQITFNAKTNPAPQAGRYTLSLKPSGDTGTPPAPGYGTVKVDQSGMVQFAGALPDGTRISQSAPISDQGVWQLIIPLSSGKGYVAGSVIFRTLALSDLDGEIDWLKAPSPKSGLYRSGFTTQLQGVGSRFTPPLSGDRALDLPDAIGNARLSANGGNLATPLEKVLTINSKNKASAVTLGTDKIALKLNISTGLMTGSFIHPVTKKTSAFTGILLQNQVMGAGFFLGTTESGSVLLEANP